MRRYHLFAALLVAATVGIADAAERAIKPPASGPAAAADRKGKEKAQYQGPTEADIRVAYTNKIDAINAGTKQQLDEKTAVKLMIRLVKVNFVECNPVEDRTDIYVCSVLVESGVGAGGTDFKRIEVAMVKEKDAWRVQ